MEVKYNDLGAQWKTIQDDALPKLIDFFNRGWYVQGKEVSEFEEKFSEYTGTKYSVGVSNGTDALKLALRVLDLDGTVDVIIQANGYIADPFSVMYQTNADYKITFIDCNEHLQLDVNLLEEHLENNRHKNKHCVIIPIHMYGHPSDMKSVMELSEKYDCKVIEDASQAHGARCYGQMVGSFGDLTAYSLYPGKNLGAMGDAGVITTNNQEYYDKLKMLREYGSKKKYHHDVLGWNNRMDTLQAILLSEKLVYLDEWNDGRNDIAKVYDAELSKFGIVPKVADYVDKHAYHIYLVSSDFRDSMQQHLNINDVPTVIHYPIPLQETKVLSSMNHLYENNLSKSYSKKILSLPIHPYMDESQAMFVADKVKEFYAQV